MAFRFKLSFINIIILINMLVYVITLIIPSVKVMFALSIFSAKEYYNGFLTYAFTHSDFMHLAFNMAMLYGFGSRLENAVGSLKISYVYMLSVFVVGFCCFGIMLLKLYFFNFDIYFMLGASGSACALLGYFCSIDKMYFKECFTAVILMSFLPLLVGINIAYDAHIIGFLFGYFLSFINFFKIKNTIL